MLLLWLHLQLLLIRMKEGAVIGVEGSQYEVLENLGEGAYATVFKGRQRVNGEVVAIKKMKKMTKNVVIFRIRTSRW